MQMIEDGELIVTRIHIGGSQIKSSHRGNHRSWMCANTSLSKIVSWLEKTKKKGVDIILSVYFSDGTRIMYELWIEPIEGQNLYDYLKTMLLVDCSRIPQEGPFRLPLNMPSTLAESFLEKLKVDLGEFPKVLECFKCSKCGETLEIPWCEFVENNKCSKCDSAGVLTLKKPDSLEKQPEPINDRKNLVNEKDLGR